MNKIPTVNAINCLNEIFIFSSLTISGIIPTNEIYKNPPLVNGNIHEVTSPASLAELYDKANIAPINPAKAVQS